MTPLYDSFLYLYLLLGSEGSDAEEPGRNEGEGERGLKNEGENRKKRFRRRSSILQIQDIMTQMEEEKRLLAEKKDMEEEERQRISVLLKKQEEDLQAAQYLHIVFCP